MSKRLPNNLYTVPVIASAALSGTLRFHSEVSLFLNRSYSLLLDKPVMLPTY
ncbi:hypothetical protein SF293071_4137 [Shigella flexneri 2930-71]|nr:hypothetical protein SF293071_4137 [Shigella flexneri 2930-71]